MDDDIICRCADVRVKDVRTFFEHYPKMPRDQMRIALNLGNGCGCCRKSDSPIIDIKFEDLHKILIESQYNQ